MGYQSLYREKKNKKTISCRLLKILPRVLSVNCHYQKMKCLRKFTRQFAVEDLEEKSII